MKLHELGKSISFFRVPATLSSEATQKLYITRALTDVDFSGMKFVTHGVAEDKFPRKINVGERSATSEPVNACYAP